jgi:hypothetical protein
MRKVHGFFRRMKKPMQRCMDLNTNTKKKSKSSRDRKNMLKCMDCLIIIVQSKYMSSR